MSWWDDVKFVVTGEQGTLVKSGALGRALGQASAVSSAAGAAAGPGSGSAGAITMSREEMEDTLKRAQNLYNDITNELGPAESLTRLRSPADDQASKDATAAANNAGNYYVGHLRRQQAYLTVVIDKLKAALGKTVQADEDSGQAVKDAGGGLIG